MGQAYDRIKDAVSNKDEASPPAAAPSASSTDKPVAPPSPTVPETGPKATTTEAPSAAPQVEPKRVPNPNGKKGGQAHQDKVNEVAQDVEDRGLIPVKEYAIPTPGGEKGTRYVDVAGLDPTTREPMETHHVGRETKGGQPVSRERKAMDDIETFGKKPRPQFHQYNNASKPPNPLGTGGYRTTQPKK